MDEKKDFVTQNQATKELLDETQNEVFPYYIEYEGLKFRVDKGVFSPKYFDGWRIFNDNFPNYKNKNILEIGTATGVTSLYLANTGANQVLAIDINEAAVANAEANKTLNHLVNVEVRHSDMFTNINPDEKFDIIYWNMPYGFVDETHVHENVLERSIFDPGYNILRRFLSDAPSFLSKEGYILIGTGSGANISEFKRIVDDFKFDLELLAKVDAKEVYTVDFQLYKLNARF